MSSIRPLNDRIIVKRSEPETRTASGIVQPDVQVGDRVIFGKYAGQTVKIDGNGVLVRKEDDILGIVESK